MHSQLEVETFKGAPFFEIPIIITTADLYILNKNLKISDIKDAKRVDEVGNKTPFLVYYQKNSKDLTAYNHQRLSAFTRRWPEIPSQWNWHSNNFNWFLEWLAGNSPRAILIMQHVEDQSTYLALFDYINKLIKTPPTMLAAMQEADAKYKA